MRDPVSNVTAQHLVPGLKLKHVLGTGASASVCLGRLRDGEPIATKLLRVKAAGALEKDEQLNETMFLLEAELMTQLSSPHIIRCLGLAQLPASTPGLPQEFSAQGETLAMLLEYMEVGSLARLVLKQMTATLQVYSDWEALMILLDVALGLNHLHTQNPPVVHRDLKMENLLLTKRNGRLEAKIADLGLHTVLDRTQHASLLRRKAVAAIPGDPHKPPRVFFANTEATEDSIQEPATPLGAEATPELSHRAWTTSTSMADEKYDPSTVQVIPVTAMQPEGSSTAATPAHAKPDEATQPVRAGLGSGSQGVSEQPFPTSVTDSISNLSDSRCTFGAWAQRQSQPLAQPLSAAPEDLQRVSPQPQQLYLAQPTEEVCLHGVIGTAAPAAAAPATATAAPVAPANAAITAPAVGPDLLPEAPARPAETSCLAPAAPTEADASATVPISAPTPRFVIGLDTSPLAPWKQADPSLATTAKPARAGADAAPAPAAAPAASFALQLKPEREALAAVAWRVPDIPLAAGQVMARAGRWPTDETRGVNSGPHLDSTMELSRPRVWEDPMMRLRSLSNSNHQLETMAPTTNLRMPSHVSLADELPETPQPRDSSITGSAGQQPSSDTASPHNPSGEASRFARSSTPSATDALFTKVPSSGAATPGGVGGSSQHSGLASSSDGSMWLMPPPMMNVGPGTSRLFTSATEPVLPQHTSTSLHNPVSGNMGERLQLASLSEVHSSVRSELAQLRNTGAASHHLPTHPEKSLLEATSSSERGASASQHATEQPFFNQQQAAQPLENHLGQGRLQSEPTLTGDNFTSMLIPIPGTQPGSIVRGSHATHDLLGRSFLAASLSTYLQPTTIVRSNPISIPGCDTHPSLDPGSPTSSILIQPPSPTSNSHLQVTDPSQVFYLGHISGVQTSVDTIPSGVSTPNPAADSTEAFRFGPGAAAPAQLTISPSLRRGTGAGQGRSESSFQPSSTTLKHRNSEPGDSTFRTKLQMLSGRPVPETIRSGVSFASPGSMVGPGPSSTMLLAAEGADIVPPLRRATLASPKFQSMPSQRDADYSLAASLLRPGRSNSNPNPPIVLSPNASLGRLHRTVNPTPGAQPPLAANLSRSPTYTASRNPFTRQRSGLTAELSQSLPTDMGNSLAAKLLRAGSTGSRASAGSGGLQTAGSLPRVASVGSGIASVGYGLAAHGKSSSFGAGRGTHLSPGQLAVAMAGKRSLYSHSPPHGYQSGMLAASLQGDNASSVSVGKSLMKRVATTMSLLSGHSKQPHEKHDPKSPPLQSAIQSQQQEQQKANMKAMASVLLTSTKLYSLQPHVRETGSGQASQSLDLPPKASAPQPATDAAISEPLKPVSQSYDGDDVPSNGVSTDPASVLATFGARGTGRNGRSSPAPAPGGMVEAAHMPGVLVGQVSLNSTLSQACSEAACASAATAAHQPPTKSASFGVLPKASSLKSVPSTESAAAMQQQQPALPAAGSYPAGAPVPDAPAAAPVMPNPSSQSSLRALMTKLSGVSATPTVARQTTQSSLQDTIIMQTQPLDSNTQTQPSTQPLSLTIDPPGALDTDDFDIPATSLFAPVLSPASRAIAAVDGGDDGEAAEEGRDRLRPMAASGGSGPSGRHGSMLTPQESTHSRISRVLADARRALSPEFQWVFNLTANTGSCMYMAPEVFMHQPYNEAVDVFSFGVVMYEVLSRSMLVFTHVGYGRAAEDSEQYAQRASTGFRPSKPEKMNKDAWRLIEACWAQDPIERPSMKQVVTRLQEVLARVPEPKAKQGCSCRVS